ncbi:hypothetical protein HUG15_04660 [Salicibibacter cibarius]|uniref:50S ribosomal protein L7/L12 n=1 Tax=Salicibibacter cibarius TaxID=2743000 RepID=A0A7T6Z154_9BACI|nr:hypothetical protein [Salicibibacter cibarius]QQK74962.1 hypothetical protein HUG15_04660 [Salicibibacter cibarius]
MSFMTKDQLYQKLEDKQILEISDLVALIESEFNVSVKIEDGDQSGFNPSELAKDPNVIRQMEGSHEDINAGRTYTGEEGLEILEQAIRKHERESTRIESDGHIQPLMSLLE